jgi:hypothetical protein
MLGPGLHLHLVQRALADLQGASRHPEEAGRHGSAVDEFRIPKKAEVHWRVDCAPIPRGRRMSMKRGG